jgi:hypothetical protein
MSSVLSVVCLVHLIKVVHYGWHNLHSKALLDGVSRLPNNVS